MESALYSFLPAPVLKPLGSYTGIADTFGYTYPGPRGHDQEKPLGPG